jgi:hypothetical protein
MVHKGAGRNIPLLTQALLAASPRDAHVTTGTSHEIFKADRRCLGSCQKPKRPDEACHLEPVGPFPVEAHSNAA